MTVRSDLLPLSLLRRLAQHAYRAGWRLAEKHDKQHAMSPTSEAA